MEVKFISVIDTDTGTEVQFEINEEVGIFLKIDLLR